MDKKNTIIGLALLCLGFGLMLKSGQEKEEQQRQDTPAGTYQPNVAPSGNSTTASAPVSISAPPQLNEQGQATVEANDNKEDEKIVSLDNSLIEARFTNYGGDLKEIVLKNFRLDEVSDAPYVMNRQRYAPALSITKLAGADKDTIYQFVKYQGDPNTIGFKAQISDSLEIERRYTIFQNGENEKPYSIRHEIAFHNTGDQPIATGELGLNVGTVAPSGKQDRFLLTFGHSDGEDVDFIESSKFLGGGFMGMFSKEPRAFIAETGNVEWASVKNQFFITILTPDAPGSGFVARPVDFPVSIQNADLPHTGITGELNIPSIVVPANGTTTIGFNYYAGPKEFSRLEKMGKKQDEAMQFGFFGIISKFLLTLMNWLYGIVGNYGLSIILLTLIVRTVLLPINMLSSKSMKRMSKLSGPMKQLKEAYPDNQQQQQKMMMELYKLNKVNPVAGCVPMIAQIPIFFALFYMLRSAAELRFEDFIWITDLSKPDTVGHVAGLPLNLLPFAWVISMAIQMWTMPTPSVDNAQAKICLLYTSDAADE